jgi:hypothetical protein
MSPELGRLLLDLLGRPYRLAMGLHALDLQDWLVVTADHAAEVAEKRRLLDAGADIHRLLPEGAAAAAETAALVEAHLATHSPAVRVDAGIGDPLTRAGLAVQEDLCLLEGSPEGYRLVGAFVAFPSRWSLAEKIGRPMPAIHAPVPGLEAAIGGPVRLFFERLQADRPVWRVNWSLTDDPLLHQPSSAFRRTATEVTAAEAGRQLWLRVERQTLRRLPRTGLVLFTILTFVEPLASLAKDRRLAGLLADRLDELPAAMLAYKNLATRRPAITSYLRAAAAA